MMSEDEESGARDIGAARAGWVRLERGVRPLPTIASFIKMFYTNSHVFDDLIVATHADTF
jgi:hypothetical protein